MFGWCGTLLGVDLSRRTFEKKTLNPDVARDFLGGRGLNAKILFDGVGPGVDPLGPKSLLCLLLESCQPPRWGSPAAFT